MSDIAPGWYKDPADTTTQRYWDGGGWIGEPIPADAPPPPGPPPVASTAVSAAAVPAEGLPPATVDPEAPSVAPPSVPPPSVPPPTVGPPNAVAPHTAPPHTAPPHTARPRLAPPPGWPTGQPYPVPAAAAVPRPHGLALAGVGSRFVARLVDVLAVLLLCAVANSWFAYQWWQEFLPFLRGIREYQVNGGPLPESSEVNNLLLMMCLVATAVWFAYEVPGSANSGQTLGKRLLGIKVVRLESDERLGFGRAFRRWGRLGLPTLLWSCCGIGFLLQFLDCVFVAIDRPLHQALHDKAAATVVVQVARPAPGDSKHMSGAVRGGGRHADPR